MFDGNKSLGVPALDLATAGERLKFDWFRRYLLDPQSLRPGTRMPAFWPNGEASNKDILGGDTGKQIFALWSYVARKNFTDLPPGLIQGKMELVAEKEAIVYRNFIEGAGPRAIGVGYPEKANLAFDADDMAPRPHLAGRLHRCRAAPHRPRAGLRETARQQRRAGPARTGLRRAGQREQRLAEGNGQSRRLAVPRLLARRPAPAHFPLLME
ncbi:MAG: hypothetical protein WDN28_18065 [Chthoniobacter sp.]